MTSATKPYPNAYPPERMCYRYPCHASVLPSVLLFVCSIRPSVSRR